jgi:GNAT superfamily N-acetyltransferase
VDLRRGRLDDSVEIAEVWLRSRKATVPAIPPPVHSDEEVRAWFQEVVLPNREVWVAQAGGNIIALLVLNGDWVDQLYVEPTWTGNGVGSRLLDMAKEQRPTALKLWTFQANVAARRFYERQGFVAIKNDARRQRRGSARHPLRLVGLQRTCSLRSASSWKSLPSMAMVSGLTTTTKGNRGAACRPGRRPA